MSSTIYVVYRDDGYGPSDFSYYSTYERAWAAIQKKEAWAYRIVAVDEGESDE